MKDLEKYESPLIEVIDVEVEKGFATSAGAGAFGNGNTSDWESAQTESLVNDIQNEISDIDIY